MVKRLFLLLDAIKFEHSIFALPFAYIGMVMAAGGFPSWDKIIWITVAMVGARTLAMATNRVADAHYDALNPRTAGRAIPKGVLSRWDMVVLAVAGLVVMFFAAWQLNPLCLQLAPLAAVVLIGYSWTKRFTWLSHAVLGLADGCAPAGGWIAVTGTVDLPAVLLGLAVLFWVGGFDLIYACQDVDFDRRYRLHSFPARFGIAAALLASSFAHVLTLLLLALTGLVLGLGWLYWIGLAISGALLIYEHRLVKPDDLSKLGVSFFNVNGYVAVIVFLFSVGGLYV
ncbi:MAG: UbiA-like polyprenyltransferase [Chloroflexota bacterium]|jgi:4-hydroxybenzoate polyprenyltransferase